MNWLRGALVAPLAFAFLGFGPSRAQFPDEMRITQIYGPGESIAELGPEETQDTPIVLSLDDGTYEAALGVTSQNGTVGNQAYFLNRFTLAPETLPFTIDAVSILFPVTAGGQSTRLRGGEQFDILIFVDPEATGTPGNTTLRVRKSFSVQPSNTVAQLIQLDLPIVIQSGDIWVGFTNTSTRTDNRGIFPAAIDSSSLNQNRSYAFFNGQAGGHFDGPLATAGTTTIVQGNWLIRVRGQSGGFTCVTWGTPAASLVDGGLPPPINPHVCDDVPEPLGAALERPRGTGVMGYKVYRNTTPGVQPAAGNLFTSVPPTQLATGSSVGENGSFFVITAVYDNGESGPSTEVAVIPPTVTKVVVTDTKVAITASGMTPDFVQLFVDGIPFVSPAVLKKQGTKLVQKGTLVTGQTMGAYLASHNNHARMVVRNSTGAIRALDFSR